VSSGDDRYGVETVKTRFVFLTSQILDSWTAMGEEQSQCLLVTHYGKNSAVFEVYSHIRNEYNIFIK
jgi:hypothetical protein